LRSLIKQKKKYDLLTIIIVVAILTTLAIFALVFTNFISELGSDLKESADDLVSDGSINSENANYSTDFISNDLPKYSDNYVFWFFVAVFIGLILTALYLEFEPSVMIIIFIFGIIAILGAWLGSQIHTEFAEDESLSVTAGEMSKTTLLMSSPYFPIFIFIGLIVIIIIMYSKKRSGEYQ
jgi:hypothetical protein